MKVYGLQFDIAWENKARNRERLLQWFEETQPEAGSWVALPELTCVGFSMRRDGLAEEPEQETEHFYSQLAQRHGITLVGGVSWWGEEGRGRNVALVIGPDGNRLGHYAKTHPFSFSGEHQHYQAGQERLLLDWQGLKVAPLICYDLRFPETFRHLALDGAELFVVIANWPSPRVHHWESLLVARAIENQAYVLGVNRSGRDPQVAYPGSSRLIDPQGQILAQLGDEEGHLSYTLDLDELRAYRQRFPALSDIVAAELGR